MSRKKNTNQERKLIYSTTTNERSSMFDQKRNRLDFAKMIIKFQYPLDMAEPKIFNNFVKNLQPMFEFQPKDPLLIDIHHIYKKEKETLQLYFTRKSSS